MAFLFPFLSAGICRTVPHGDPSLTPLRCSDTFKACMFFCEHSFPYRRMKCSPLVPSTKCSPPPLTLSRAIKGRMFFAVRLTPDRMKGCVQAAVRPPTAYSEYCVHLTQCSLYNVQNSVHCIQHTLYTNHSACMQSVGRRRTPWVWLQGAP